ncbi:MAG: hypothetical protein Q8O88_01375 [bacterium]|nr:hypothetical protein [bacterium]
MEKPQVFIKREQAVLDWIPATSDVGSVLIYRATDNILDALGSRSIIATVASNINTYTDTASGSVFNVYRVQFFNTNGSGPISDPINPVVSDILAQIGEVKLASKISANSDIGSDEVYDIIKDASNWVYREYGDPIKKTVIYIDPDSSDESYVFDFTGNMGPVYQVRYITVGVGEEFLVSGSSFTVDYRNGQIQLASAFTSAHTGEWLRIEWVPQVMNDLVKYKAALDLTESGMIIDGEDVRNTRMEKLRRNVDEIKDAIRPRGIYAPKQVVDDLLIDADSTDPTTWAHYVGQKINRRSLIFS